MGRKVGMGAGVITKGSDDTALEKENATLKKENAALQKTVAELKEKVRVHTAPVDSVKKAK